MSIRHYVFANIGRDKGPQTSNRIDQAALNALARRCKEKFDNEQTAVMLAEIMEGDDNNEMGLVAKTFPGWKIYGRSTREPILLSPDQPEAQDSIYWVQNSSVRLWSPRRSVLVVKLADEDEALIGCHPAAGANGQGDRPKWARPLLQTSWDLTMAKKAQVKTHLHRRGINITDIEDANAYSKKIYKLLPGEQTVFQDDTDWGRVWPAEGHRAAFQYHGRIDLHIDSHDGHYISGGYPKR